MMTHTKQIFGVLLVNLGSPNTCSVPAIREFLGTFLSDPDVIDLPSPFRQILAKGIIAPLRSKKILPKYASIWHEEGSPLHVYTKQLCQALQLTLGDDFQVESAMRYCEPSMEAACEALAAGDIKHWVVIPLFPQYAKETTGSILRKLQHLLSSSSLPEPVILRDYFAEDYFVDALADLYKHSIAEFKPDVIIWSYHGLPVKSVAPICAPTCRDSGCQQICKAQGQQLNGEQSCYRAQCYATSRALEKALNLDNIHYVTAFQSRFGPLKWVGPSLTDTISDLREQGYKRLAIACPSFVTDCLETLEEVNIEAREDWLAAGGDDLLYLPCVNAESGFVAGLANATRVLIKGN
jgi:ferrochelatase